MMTSAFRDRADFPYYNGVPRPLTAIGCVLVLAACALSFAALLWLPKAVPGALGSWTAAAVFVGLQLVGLALAVGRAWTAPFHRPTVRDVLIAIAAVPFVIGVPALVAHLVIGDANLIANPEVEDIGRQTGSEIGLMFGMAAVQLLGEELVTILPLLVLLALLYRSGLGRVPSIALATIVTALAFGALHLPTYQWHVGQALLVIGTARLMLSGVYLLTRNVWASTIAHIANDWTILAFALVTARAGTM